MRDAQGPSSAARSATFTVAPGQLVVTINGLPTGVNANTLVAGPDGYSQPITNSTTLTLPPSTYTITANNVSSGGTTYTPTPTSQQRTVTSNTSTGATIAYAHAIAVTFSPTSASLSPGGTQSFTATVTGTTNTAVTWTLTPNCGTLTGTGNTRTYTAPATGPATCTLTATSNADTSRSASASIDVSAGNRPPTIDEVWLRYQSGERFECGSIIPQEYIGFYWRSSDPDGDTVTHQYRVDDGSWHDRSGTSVNLWLDDRPPGTLRTLRVRAIDSHGNVSAASSCTARVSVPPEIIDYAGPTDALGYRAGETAAFAVDVRDADGHYPSEVILMLRRDGANVATIQMALQFDHGPANKLTYVTTYRFTVAGSYDYLIWVTDALGVMANATDRVAFTIHP